MNSIAKYFGCGIVKNRKSEACDFTVTSLKNISNIIIPFFEKHPLRVEKLRNYNDFKEIVNLMISKQHLTEAGYLKIVEIKKGMNTGRI